MLSRTSFFGKTHTLSQRKAKNINRKKLKCFSIMFTCYIHQQISKNIPVITMFDSLVTKINMKIKMKVYTCP